MGWIVITALLLAAALVAWLLKRSAERHLDTHAKELAAHAAADEEAKRQAIDAGQGRYMPPPAPKLANADSYAIQRKVSKIALICLLVIAVLETLGFSFAIVSTKNEGIVTSFGAVSGHVGNGPHLIAPWESVTEMDAAIQTDSYTGANNDNGAPIAVRIGNQQTADVSISIRWRINPAMSDELFQNYRTFEHVRDSLVTRELTAAVNEQFKDYNPLNSIAAAATTGKKNPSLSDIANAVTEQMKREIGVEGIEILNTIIPIVTFDSATQNRINQLQQQFASTLIAEQQRQTNVKLAEANKALAKSVDTSPNVLVAQCMTILGEMVKENQPVPAGFSCWPGGSKIGVIAGAK